MTLWSCPKKPHRKWKSNLIFKTLQKLQRPNVRGAHQLINMITEYQFALASLGALKQQQFNLYTIEYYIFSHISDNCRQLLFCHYSTKPQRHSKIWVLPNSGPQLQGPFHQSQIWPTGATNQHYLMSNRFNSSQEKRTLLWLIPL